MCKTQINERFDIDGTAAVVAGLFGGDYLPLMAAKVGRRGTVYGFEPTDAVDVSRALADANSLSNVRITKACLSNDTSVVRMCMRNPKLKPSEVYSTFGDRTHMVRADEELHDASGGARCGAGNVDTAGGLVRMRCRTLDEELPWQTDRVGFLLLDVEGAEEKVLWGAKGLTSRWRPIIATEPRLELKFPDIFQRHLATLGYHHSGHCEGLNFYYPGKLGHTHG